jgi:hypothetical protein
VDTEPSGDTRPRAYLRRYSPRTQVSAATADAKTDGGPACADLEDDRHAGTSCTKVEAACVGVADCRSTAASGDRQRAHRATAIAPPDSCATTPRGRNRDRYRRGACTNNKTRLTPIRPRSLTGRNNLLKVGGRHGERAEHQPVAPGAVRKLCEKNDVRAGDGGAAYRVQPCGWRCPSHAQGSGDEAHPDEATKHFPRRYAAVA